MMLLNVSMLELSDKKYILIDDWWWWIGCLYNKWAIICFLVYLSYSKYLFQVKNIISRVCDVLLDNNNKNLNIFVAPIINSAWLAEFHTVCIIF